MSRTRADGDGIRVAVRRQEGDTWDVRFVKGTGAGALRTLRASTKDGGAAAPGGGPEPGVEDVTGPLPAGVGLASELTSRGAAGDSRPAGNPAAALR